jgi:response regulator RpfG family c-di-GMP phosphodiesterase
MSQIPLGASIAQREISPFAQMNIIELVRHLMQQVEQKHPRYYNHLEQQRTVLQAMLRRLNFSAAESQSLWLAFYLHHISLPEPHYCLLNLYEGEELQKKCQSQFKSDIALFERFVLPQETMQILFYLYERFDGEGFPEGIKQNDIPIGSRVLAILDSYEELLYTMPTITSEQINQKLCEHSDSLFDKRLLDIFFEELKRIERHTKGTLPKILLFDRDQDLIDELERMLWERGFWVQTTNNMTQAEYLCQRENFDLIVLDIDLGENEDGFAWIEQIRINCNSVPEFVILTHQDQQEKLDRGMALARDYLIKPTNTNLSLVLAKLSKHIEQLENEKKKLKLPAKAIHGLTGSLDQLGLPEILQVLSQSRRSGQLTIESKEHKGLIYLQDGEVFNASMGEFTGEAAFGKMMSWHQGEFNFNPNIPTGERLIHKRLDGLILDTLRILDESVRDGIEDPFDSFDLSFEPEQPEDKTAAKEHEAFFDLSLDDEDMPFSIQLLEDEDSTDKKQKDDSIPPPPFPPKIQ